MTPSMEDARRAMSRVFKFNDFRADQETIIQSVLAGADVLAVMPTGGGKSLCYQLPAILRPGLTVVVSPLIALMRDQVMQLRAAGVNAGALNSGNMGGESLAVERAIEERRLKLVYVAPERFALPGLVDLFKRGGANCLAIDEAHCISQWGHDFRPEYLGLRQFGEELGTLQTIAVTATADAPTRAEIIERLFARAPRVLVSSFDRPNLRLAMEPKRDAFAQISAFLDQRRSHSGIIYCASRERTEKFALALSARGHRAIAYHAGLEPEMRGAHQDEFIQASGVIMCATIAFGMGVDKPDARFVCHADTPGSIEAYYQEIGRAGRDGTPADTITLWSENDLALRRKRILENNAPRARKLVELRKLDALRGLCESTTCRRQGLLAAFGEASQPCGNCDICDLDAGLFGSRASLVGRLRAHGRRLSAQIGKALSGEAVETLRRRARNWPENLLVGRLAQVREPAEPMDASIDAVVDDAARQFEPSPALFALTTGEQRLFAALKARRLALARSERCPVHAIASDLELRELARRRPVDFEPPTPKRFADALRDVVRSHETGTA